jgi:photosystem II stability/assembly factor-like uncharacterized protein
MTTQTTCAAIIIALLCPPASAQWTQTTISGGASVILAFAVSGDNLFAGTQDGGVLRSTDGGAHWSAANTNLTDPFVRALAVSGTNLFAGTFGSGVFRSTDNGAGWAAVNGGMMRTYVQALAVSGINLFAGYIDSVFRSTNNGATWTEVNNGLSSLPDIRAFVVSGTTLFAGTSGAYPRGVYLSTDNGTHWTTANNQLASENIRTLAVSGTYIYAGTDGSGIFLSTDKGTSWTAVNTGLPTNVSGNALAVSGANIFAGSASGNAASGIFVSTDNGAHWTTAGSGLTNPDVVALAVAGTYLYAGTFGDGIWRRPLSEMVTSVPLSSGELPARFSLEHNYPNPFNPSTAIKYELPNSSDVRLSVYDMLGREVAVLVNERRDAGVHEVTFDGSNLASGVYFYRLQAGALVQSRKLVLLR